MIIIDVLYSCHTIFPCIKYDNLFQKKRVHFDALSIVVPNNCLVGLSKQSSIGCLDLIGWMSDIYMHSIGFLNKGIQFEFRP